jgi:hypothetical protein
LPDGRAIGLEYFSVRFDYDGSGWRIGTAVAKHRRGGSDMKSHYLKSRISKVLFAVLFLVGVSAVAGTSVQAQWPYGQDPYRRDRDDRRDRDRDRDDRYRRNGNYGNYNQIAFNQGYQDGIYTGSNDGQRGQNYNPQRSHFYRNGHGDNGGYGRGGNSYQFQQAYRQGFLRGYDEGFRRNNYNRRRNGNYGRWPF